MRRRLTIAVGLTLLGGYVDAAGYLALAKLFVAHMSGNAVRAAIEIAAGNWSKAASVGIPVVCFVLSAACGAALARIKRWWPLAVETVLFAAFAALAHVLQFRGDEGFGGATTAMGSLLVFALGLQNTVLKTRSVGQYRGTTFITGMFGSLGETATEWAATRRSAPDDSRAARGECLRFARRIAVYFAGAIAGALVFAALRLHAFDAAVAAALVLAFVEYRWPAPDDEGA